MSREDLPQFNRLGGDLSFDDMRAQMEKEREAFFRDKGGDWSTDGRPGLFNRPTRSSYGGSSTLPGHGVRTEFPSGLSSGGESLLLGGLPATRPGSCSSSTFPRNRSTTTAAAATSGEENSSHSKPKYYYGSGGGGEGQDSIPIKVVHSKQPKYSYGGGGGRHTTEIPAGGTSRGGGGSESPRLERAASEPPNKLNQRLNLGRAANQQQPPYSAHQYSTIPENSEGVGVAGGWVPQHHLTSGGLQQSASAPSVGGGHHQPVPPPRRSPPRHNHNHSSSSSNNNNNNMQHNTEGNSGPAVPTAGPNNVRHIPIFVEGRTEPIFNTNFPSAPSSTTSGGGPESPFSKPSDFYPPGVHRVRSRDSEGGGSATPELGAGGGGGDPFRNNPQFRAQSGPVGPVPEPTTPLGPPPGTVIPMGYIPLPTSGASSVNGEPTTPQGPPPGPIAMGYTPSSVSAAGPAAVPQDPDSGVHPAGTGPVSRCEDPAPQQQHHSSPPPPSSQQQAASPPSPPTRNRSGQPDSTDHGAKSGQSPPVVNFIPIRVHHAEPDSGPSQPGQNQPQAGRSPTPARKPTGPEHPHQQQQQQKTSSAAADPKILKLEQINCEVEKLRVRIAAWHGSRTDKDYLQMDDLLTKHLITLDGIDTEGREAIRVVRKEVINAANECLSLLDERSVEGGGGDSGPAAESDAGGGQS